MYGSMAERAQPPSLVLATGGFSSGRKDQWPCQTAPCSIQRFRSATSRLDSFLPDFLGGILSSASFVDAGVSLAFTAPVVPSDATITHYQYDVSYDGGTTWQGGSPAGFYAYLDTTTSPAIACRDWVIRMPMPKSHKLAPVHAGDHFIQEGLT